VVGHEGSPRARTCSLEGGERRTRQAFAILGEDEEGDQEVAIALDTPMLTPPWMPLCCVLETSIYRREAHSPLTSTSLADRGVLRRASATAVGREKLLGSRLVGEGVRVAQRRVTE